MSRLIERTQSLAADDFFYFFLRLRKSRVRSVVKRVQQLHPGETPDQLARRLTDSTSQLALLAGGFFQAPLLLPGVGPALKALGLVGGASALTRMHLYLILEIALLYGKDIDDPARVSEMLAVVGATAAASSLPPLALRALGVVPLVGIPASALSSAAMTRVIGERASALYGARGSVVPAPA